MGLELTCRVRSPVQVEGFVAAFPGAIVVSVVSTLLSLLAGNQKKRD